MKIFHVLCGVVLLLSISLTVRAQQSGERMTVQGVIQERRADVKSVESWNAPGDPYYIIEIDAGGEHTLRPSANVSVADLQKFVGQHVTLKGYYTEGKRPETPIEATLEQAPIEPKLEINAAGEIVNTGSQVMKRGWGLVVLAIVTAPPAVITMPGTVFDYEWAHGANRLALLVVDQERRGKFVIVDAERKAALVEIPIPAAYRPRCFAWLADDSGFLLAMAKPENEEEFAEDNFYRYPFAGQQFEEVYQDAERQYADIFSIEVDQGTAFWAAASVGEGHPDLLLYQDAATVLATDVYPGSIAPVLWQDHRLWCVTEAYLEFGFTREERERNPLFNPQTSPERDYGNGIAYRIDPLTKQATPDPIELPALEAAMQTSADHRYLLELTQNESTFTLSVILNE